MLQSFLVSTSVVALAEIGDKTQLLSLMLAARYRKPLPIVAGVLAATLVNHACAGGVGALVAGVLNARILNWCIVASFVLMSAWILVPDKLDENEVRLPKRAVGVFGSTLIAFFLAEMGDKTQVVTIALAARYQDYVSVVGGTTVGMLLANVPVIYLGSRFSSRLPARAIHLIAAAVFVVLGVIALRNALAGTPLVG